MKASRGPKRPLDPTDLKEIETRMKKFALLLSFVFVAGVAGAQDAAKPADKAAAPAKAAEKAAPAKAEAVKTETKAEAAKGTTHDVEAEVVAVDAAKGTLTLKGEKENKTVPVDAKAVAGLKDVKAGDKLTLTCWDNAKGEHEKVVGFKKAEAVKAPEKK